ncbi:MULTISPECIES: prepilin-type N-terminal cleavage/methylation domain-containing protein [Idiomarina]|jgi:prepilin peptidase dependent protein B|uniref:prepilin-type N-terminal cleavage/methylation domain-containing protein n=1 Tax=Idiomarina TaxID=135575 RepID=UPI000C41A67B|nr:MULTISPECIES: prepilin-type N-terminal cleavage/methylation domain-containing protein [Idiomarina]MAO67503.1 prepilin peptidase dependent protein B-like protein [Idiomarina sp.]MBF80314.1 prepilin peptidase dependent protein B-like protein [Idiomarina sp.]|tara:strand:- start:7281 stop:7790 length:510 start_codon:yes stop_codon:yes gene_type:complete
MLVNKNNGYSLVEVLIAAALGSIIVLTAQQIIQWQKGAQLSAVSSAQFILGGQAVSYEFFENLNQTVAGGVQHPQSNCFIFPTQSGGSVGFRVRYSQLQHNPMTLDCSGYGWQSLTDKTQFEVQELMVETSVPPVADGASKLFITLIISRVTKNGVQEQPFKRSITIFS